MVMWVVCGLIPSDLPQADAHEMPKPRTITVRLDNDNPPYEFTENGVPTGFNIEILQAVARQTGLRPTLVPGTSNELWDDLQSGKTDAVSGMYYSVEYDEKADFSTPHLKVFHAIFTRPDTGITSFADLRNARVIVLKNDIMRDYLNQSGMTKNITLAENPLAALKMLSAGTVDAAILGKMQGLYLADMHNLNNLHTVGVPFAPRSYCFAVRQGNTGLLHSLNEGLGTIQATGEYTRIYDAWFGHLQPASMLDRALPYILIVLAVLVFILLITFVWLWSLKTKVASRTAALQGELRQRKIAEARLKEFDERLKSIFASMSDLVFVMDREGRFVEYFQPENTSQLYLPPSVFMGKLYQDVLPPHLATLLEGAIKTSLKTGEAQRIEYSLQVGQTPQWYSANVTIRKNAQGEYAGTTLVARDITQQHFFEQVLKIERDIGIEFGWSDKLESSLEKVLQATMQIPGIETGAIFITDAIQAELRLACYSGLPDGYADVLQTYAFDSIEYLTIVKGDSIYSDVHTPIFPSFEEYRRKLGFKAAILIPVMHRGHVVASLNLASYSLDEFSKEIRQALNIIANRVGSIVERISAYEAVRASENKFRSIIEQSSEGIALLEHDGTVIDWNNAAIQILGLQREQVFGQTIDVILESMMDVAAPDILSLRNALTSVGDKQQNSSSLHVTVAHVSGERRFIRLTVFPIDIKGETLFGLVMHDLTDMRKASEDIRKSEELFRMVFRTSPDPLMISRLSDGMYLDVNESFASIIGYDRSEIIGRTSIELKLWKTAESRTAFIETMQRGGSVRNYEVEFQDKQGTTHWALLSGAVIELDDEPHTLTLGRDITEMKNAEAEKKHVEAQLRHQQKLESIGTLASGVAHEINNPLNIVMNYAQLIMDSTPQNSTEERNAREIIRESERIAAIVRSLLAFSRKESESKSPEDLSSIIRDTLSLIRRILESNQIRITVDIPDNLPTVVCKRQQIQQVLMNLFTNARDALNEKYPAFSENKHLSISVHIMDTPGGAMVRTSITDTGKGIPEAVREQIFDPFFTTKSRAMGTGLGLSVSLGIVRENGGTLSFDTREGEYTSFFLDLPVGSAI